MQIKAFLTGLLLIGAILSFAQQEQGIDFYKAKSWADVKAKAKAENKYIFVDAFTTWCGPCKVMAAKIFPQPEVGAFFNPNYINLKVQLDTTGQDNDYIKSWYQDAHNLMVNYKVNVFPTYLFFSPDGEIVHREVGSSDAVTFINKGKDALIPEKQYYALFRKYEAGNREPGFLKTISYAARGAYDRDNTPTFTKAYLATQKDLLTEDNLKFLSDFTQSSKDPGFKYMLENPEKFDAIKEPGYAANVVKSIILSEEIYPVVFPRTPGAANTVPDWANIDKTLKTKYPTLAEEIGLQAKILYYQQKKDWPAFSKAITQLLQQSPKSMQPAMLNDFAWTIFEGCDDIACVRQALAWSEKSVEKDADPMYLDTYANLLHKTGDSKKAITVQERAIELLKKSGEDASDYEATLEKIKKGEKTW